MHRTLASFSLGTFVISFRKHTTAELLKRLAGMVTRSGHPSQPKPCLSFHEILTYTPVLCGNLVHPLKHFHLKHIAISHCSFFPKGNLIYI